MTPETDENGSEPGDPRNTQPASPTAGGDQVPSDVGSRNGVQPAPPTTPAARGRNDALWAGLATTVAVAAMLWIAYQSNVRNEVTQVQKQLEAQHADLQALKDKIQVMTAAQGRTDVQESQPSMREIQGLQNHVDTLRALQKQSKAGLARTRTGLILQSSRPAAADQRPLAITPQHALFATLCVLGADSPRVLR
jgi:hypothetical protein